MGKSGEKEALEIKISHIYFRTVKSDSFSEDGFVVYFI